MIGRSIIGLIQKDSLQDQLDAEGGEGNVMLSPGLDITSSVQPPGIVEFEDSKDINFEHYKGTITELWSLAIHKYPHIVSEHGAFSGPLLESMLGIEAMPAEKVMGVNGHVVSKQMQKSDETLLSGDNKANSSSMRRKSMSRRRMHKSVGSSSSIGENLTDENDGNLIRPLASLVRSMRRCQYKWLPLLDTWQEVDLVLTKFELVWLATKPFNGLWDKDVETRRDSVSKLLRSRKGGKGISLSDTVVGREIIGRLPLEDIEEIKVHRFPPNLKLQKQKIREQDAENASDEFHFSSEFWAESLETPSLYIGYPDERFQRVVEDNLLLHSRQGTLCLRFLVDLVDEEKREHRNTNVNYLGMKEGALLWCQTISHLCGPRQLKQKLTYFGENAEKELLDFVEIQDRKSHQLFKPSRWSGKYR
jgi:hypothetical protein